MRLTKSTSILKQWQIVISSSTIDPYLMLGFPKWLPCRFSQVVQMSDQQTTKFQLSADDNLVDSWENLGPGTRD